MESRTWIHRDMHPQFLMFLFDIGHPCYGQLTPVKTRYPQTSITWSYRCLKFRAHQVCFFLKLTADQVLVFKWIMGSCQFNLLVRLLGNQLMLTLMFFTAFGWEQQTADNWVLNNSWKLFDIHSLSCEAVTLKWDSKKKWHIHIFVIQGAPFSSPGPPSRECKGHRMALCQDD